MPPLWGRGHNKVSVTAASGLCHCELSDLALTSSRATVERPSNRGRMDRSRIVHRNKLLQRWLLVISVLRELQIDRHVENANPHSHVLSCPVTLTFDCSDSSPNQDAPSWSLCAPNFNFLVFVRQEIHTHIYRYRHTLISPI